MGWQVTCWAWLVINLASFACHLRFMLPIFVLKHSTFLKALLPSLTSSTVMLLSLLLLREHLGGEMPEALLLIVMIMAGVVLFSVTQLLLFRRQLFTALGYLRH